MRKGQLATTAVMSAGVAFLLAALGWGFSQTNRLGAAETRISVVEVQYEALNKSLDKTNEKLDRVLELLGERSSKRTTSTQSKLP